MAFIALIVIDSHWFMHNIHIYIYICVGRPLRRSFDTSTVHRRPSNFPALSWSGLPPSSPGFWLRRDDFRWFSMIYHEDDLFKIAEFSKSVFNHSSHEANWGYILYPSIWINLQNCFLGKYQQNPPKKCWNHTENYWNQRQRSSRWHRDLRNPWIPSTQNVAMAKSLRSAFRLGKSSPETMAFHHQI